MKIVLYTLRLFFPLFLGAMITFAFIFELVDLMMNIWRYISNSVPTATVIAIMLNYLPKTLTWALPLSVLFASCLMLSSLYSQNEMTAVFASGISIFKFATPLLVLATLLSFGLFLFQETVVVKSSIKYEELKEIAFNQKKEADRNFIVIFSEDGNKIYRADFFDQATNRIRRLDVVERNEDTSLKMIISADIASWDDEAKYWRLQGGYVYRYEGGKIVSSPVTRELERGLTEPPETFLNNPISIEAATIPESRAYINHLRRTGLPYAEPLSQYYNKFSFPFVVLIVVFLSVGISGRGRRNVFVISLALSLSAAVVFYVTQLVTMLMAKFSMLPPIVGAWSPVVLFMIIGVVLLRYSQT